MREIKAEVNGIETKKKIGLTNKTESGSSKRLMARWGKKSEGVQMNKKEVTGL